MLPFPQLIEYYTFLKYLIMSLLCFVFTEIFYILCVCAELISETERDTNLNFSKYLDYSLRLSTIKPCEVRLDSVI